MALSSWLGFGKKKTSPDSDTFHDSKIGTPSDVDDYVVIERRSKPEDSMYPTLGIGSSLPYQVQPLPSTLGQVSLPTSSDVHPSNPLDDVPFKLSSTLSGSSREWSRSEAAYFQSLMSTAIHHNETVYKYDFSHEKSIMRESDVG